MSEVDAWGIQARWYDAHGRCHEAPAATVEMVRTAIGEAPPDLEERAPIVTRPGRALADDLGPVEVVCEDGSTRSFVDVVPEDFPLGYHRLTTAAGVERSLIVSPGRCWLPEQQRWGWAVQLYAARSRDGWGIGDLADLRTLREWTASLGGGFLMVNPLHAVGPGFPQEASPYLPATRRFRNPVYLRVEDVVGYAGPPGGLADARDTRLIDRDLVWLLKDGALRAIFSEGPEPGFDAWRAEQGESLELFARWSVIAAQHGTDWHDWPAELHDPDGAAVATYCDELPGEVAYHAWLQWQLDQQLAAATGEMTVIQDLPIGVSGGGADAWVWQDELAHGVTVGAPADKLNTVGQDWGSPPLVPWRLRAADYRPFVESLRATIAGAGGLRIDHVMGLFRLWWVPEGEKATEGAYVHYPSEDLLDIVCLESHRAGAVIVGEDLGTVPEGVPDALASRSILSYKLLWFEDQSTAEWPPLALGAVTTHDLPTITGLWLGSDVQDQLDSSDMAEQDVLEGRAELMARLRRDSPLDDGSTVQDAIVAAYSQLAEAPCLLLGVALEDAVAQERRPNVPGTTARPNWRIPLDLPLEDLVEHPLPRRIAGLF